MRHHIYNANVFKAQAKAMGYICKGDIMDTNSAYIKVYKDNIYIGKVRFSDHSNNDPTVDYCTFTKGASGLLKWLKDQKKKINIHP